MEPALGRADPVHGALALSDLVVGAGTTYRRRRRGASHGGDGTTRIADEPLEEGDSYTVAHLRARPDRARRCAAAPRLCRTRCIQYTAIHLPEPGETAHGRPASAGSGGDAGARSRCWGDEPYGDPRRRGARSRRSPYGDMYRLARELTAGAPTMYDAVKRDRALPEPQLHLQREPRRAPSTR